MLLQRQTLYSFKDAKMWKKQQTGVLSRKNVCEDLFIEKARLGHYMLWETGWMPFMPWFHELSGTSKSSQVPLAHHLADAMCSSAPTTSFIDGLASGLEARHLRVS